jgi:hypothetical protein
MQRTCYWAASVVILAMTAGCSSGTPPALPPVVPQTTPSQAVVPAAPKSPTPAPKPAAQPTAAPTPTPSAPAPTQTSAAATPSIVLLPEASSVRMPALPDKGRAFFGVPVGEAHKIAFICDRSGSMTDSIDLIKYELKRCLSELKEEDLFDVLFMSSGPPVDLSREGLIPATEKNKERAYGFIDDMVPQGETSPTESVKRAFKHEPEVIFIISDGEFDRSLIDLVKGLNVGGKVKVNTIAFLYKSGEDVNKKIAEQNGGTYRFITEADLEKMFR